MENKNKSQDMHQLFHRVDQANISADKENIVDIVIERKKRQ